MRHTLLLSLLVFSVSSQAQNEWMSMASYDANGRHHPITVANDQYGYVIAGQAGFAALNLDDVYRYDPSSDSWEEMEAFPGGGRAQKTRCSMESIHYHFLGDQSGFQ